MKRERISRISTLKLIGQIILALVAVASVGFIIGASVEVGAFFLRKTLYTFMQLQEWSRLH